MMGPRVVDQSALFHEFSLDAPERASRDDTIRLWHEISTTEAPEWTARYHASDPAEKAFGGELVVSFVDGAQLSRAIAVANAHPLGTRPFARPDYVGKFHTLASVAVSDAERSRFLESAENIANLPTGQLARLNVEATETALADNPKPGIL
ncbi:MAG: hypothetical protein AAFX81_17750 [Pseudomonadota bacterium]